MVVSPLLRSALFYFWMLGFAICSFGLGAKNRDQSIGMRRIVTQVADVDVGVRFFYPSFEHAAVTGFGAWMLPLVKNARLRAGTYPLVMVSHGLGGNSWNHHLLAQSLVQAGFIVAAVDHPDDLLRLGSPEHTVLRPLELKAGLDAVLLDNGFKAQIDPDRIGVFGYSLGGFTALAAAGGRASFSQIVKHCATSRNDLAFCIGNKAANALPIYRPPRVHLDQDLYDPRFKALVLAAPVGAPFEDLDRVKLPAFLVRASADKTLRAPYHAEKIHRLLPQPHRYEVIEGLRHYAFYRRFRRIL